MFQNKLTDKETCTTLTLANITPARFYLLPKIHKNNNPGRPVISSFNCDQNIQYVVYYIQPLAKKIKSYIRDTTDLLNKINHMQTVPESATLVTMDVRSLYSNVKRIEGLTALKEVLTKRTKQDPSRSNHKTHGTYTCIEYFQFQWKTLPTWAS